MAKLKSAWWRPQSLAALGHLSDEAIVQQQGSYVKWLRERWGCDEEDALNIIEVQRGDMEAAEAPMSPPSRVREERWLSPRVCIRTVRTYTTGKHWEFSSRSPSMPAYWHWCRLHKSDAPTTYAVVVDGRLRGSFLRASRARECAELIIGKECS